jgi:hypothetical protein
MHILGITSQSDNIFNVILSNPISTAVLSACVFGLPYLAEMNEGLKTAGSEISPETISF